MTEVVFTKPPSVELSNAASSIPPLSTALKIAPGTPPFVALALAATNSSEVLVKMTLCPANQSNETTRALRPRTH